MVRHVTNVSLTSYCVLPSFLPDSVGSSCLFVNLAVCRNCRGWRRRYGSHTAGHRCQCVTITSGADLVDSTLKGRLPTGGGGTDTGGGGGGTSPVSLLGDICSISITASALKRCDSGDKGCWWWR